MVGRVVIRDEFGVHVVEVHYAHRRASARMCRPLYLGRRHGCHYPAGNCPPRPRTARSAVKVKGPREETMINLYELYEPPTSWVVAGLLVLIGTYAAVRGAGLMVRALRGGRALDLVRGIRVVIIAFVSGVFALGVLAAESGFVVLGAIVLAEELYETATLATLLRHAADKGPAASLARSAARST